MESSIAFRLLRDFMHKKYGKKETRKRIVVTTTFDNGVLHNLAQEEDYKLFEIKTF